MRKQQLKKLNKKNKKIEKSTSEQANERASNEQLHQINTNLFCNYKQEINKRASEQASKRASDKGAQYPYQLNNQGIS